MCLSTFTAKMRSNSASVMALTGLVIMSSGVVDEDVQFSEPGDGFVKQPHNLGHAPDISLDGKRLAAGRFNFGHEFSRRIGLRGIIHRHGGAITAQAFDNGATDPARRAGDQRDFSFQRIAHGLEKHRRN